MDLRYSVKKKNKNKRTLYDVWTFSHAMILCRFEKNYLMYTLYRFEMASVEWNVQHSPEKNLRQCALLAYMWEI